MGNRAQVTEQPCNWQDVALKCFCSKCLTSRCQLRLLSMSACGGREGVRPGWGWGGKDSKGASV